MPSMKAEVELIGHAVLESLARGIGARYPERIVLLHIIPRVDR